MTNYVLKVSVNGLTGYLSDERWDEFKGLFAPERRYAKEGLASELVEDLLKTNYSKGDTIFDYFEADKIRIEFEEVKD